VRVRRATLDHAVFAAASIILAVHITRYRPSPSSSRGLDILWEFSYTPFRCRDAGPGGRLRRPCRLRRVGLGEAQRRKK
jgi:hypothetical protein